MKEGVTRRFNLEVANLAEQVMDTFLRCQVSPGLFSGEVAIRAATADGTEFSLFVADRWVEYEAPPADDGHVEGWVRVELLAREGALMLVRLPGQPFENGQTVTVRDSQVERRARRETV